MTDWCTWDADYNVHIVEEIRKSLVALATTATNEYTSALLLQGSGTYCVEAVIGSPSKTAMPFAPRFTQRPNRLFHLSISRTAVASGRWA